MSFLVARSFGRGLNMMQVLIGGISRAEVPSARCGCLYIVVTPAKREVMQCTSGRPGGLRSMSATTSQPSCRLKPIWILNRLKTASLLFSEHGLVVEADVSGRLLPQRFDCASLKLGIAAPLLCVGQLKIE
jgi:hypothetical protein